MLHRIGSSRPIVQGLPAAGGGYLSVCLSVGPQVYIPGTKCQIITKFYVHVTYTSVFPWRRCDMLCAFDFKNDVICAQA